MATWTELAKYDFMRKVASSKALLDPQRAG
jgi:hypothetical protein